jgi:serpin B
MMNQVDSFRYAEGDNYQAVELLYDGRELSMVILLPTDGEFTDFRNSLDAPVLESLIAKLGTHQVTLAMPKFEFDSDFGLKDALSNLGMGIAFSPGAADLSGMSGGHDLYIQDVIHKAFVSVDEAGTEAAAATAVIVGTTSLPPSAEMTIDSPFIFAIRDNATGSIIFLGQVTDPSM